ncbi:diacylglycerol kinase [Oxobacter pfennigii]|uniref:Diacylglycerol kinase n=1 Tax=Oxobacter pfennigii TaxID=36849 RepID=A0A0P8Y743_9CLOT|nr:diacylglycerol kinase family protein [Oxobacter pfennigii]KPU42274.1 diacylglycerol kinase [Oxobacter pfennigii]
MKVLFIINPAAGKGRALKEAPVIKAVMEKWEKIEYDIAYTERIGHAVDIAKAGCKNGYKIIFAVGGDGTVNEVVNGTANTNTALAILPYGSGNDFFRSLGIKGDTEKIINDTLNGQIKNMDIGIVNGRYFINISSVGFDAEVVLATNKAKKFLSGSIAYIAALITTIFKRKSENIKMLIDEGEVEKKVLLAAVANGRFYGGGMEAAPYAVLDDGLFDICFIENMPKFKMLVLFPQFMKGKHEKFKEVKFYRSKKVYIECDRPLPLNIDGEVYKEKSIRFEIINKGFLLAAPLQEAMSSVMD